MKDGDKLIAMINLSKIITAGTRLWNTGDTFMLVIWYFEGGKN